MCRRGIGYHSLLANIKMRSTIIDTDAYHLLFGQLWQYDVDAQHARKENLYKLEKDRVKYTLLPLGVVPHSKGSKPEGRSFLTIAQSKKEMEEIMKKSKEVHALVVKNVLKMEEESSKDILEGVKEVLEEFKNVIPYDLPEGLPPLKDIQH